MADYKAKDIQVLEGLDAVRMRPGMYIGTTGNKGLHHILWEIIDNGIDEITNGHGNRVEVELLDDNVMRVTDNGRGVPVDKHPKLGISGVEVVYTQLHAGAKFDNESYGFSGGLHGVGASVTNALSEWMTVEVFKDGNHYRQDFHSPEVNGKIKSGAKLSDLKVVGKTKETGTRVTFKADERVFGSEKYDYDVIAERLREIAFLNKQVTLVLKDERLPFFGGTGKFDTFRFEGGVSDFVAYLNEEKDAIYRNPILLEGKDGNFIVSVAFQHTDSYSENIISYVNNIPTSDGGTHEVGFKSAITRVLNDYARKSGFLKDKDANFLGEDFREGMTAVLSIKMQNIQFEGQTKTKLGNPEAKLLTEQIVSQKLDEYINLKSSKSVVDKILNKASGAAKTRESVKKAKEISRKKNSLDGAPLIGKLASCSGRKPEFNELFIVEGDSAGGSAKQGRDRRTQAILPLKGKPLNVEKQSIDKILDNDEIRTIITALGTGIDDDFDINDLRYHKVIILADADYDGAHIRALLLTFFFRHMKELVLGGHVYMGMPPLYKLSKKDLVRYCYDDEELEEARKDFGRNYNLQRYKGLGEMNPEQLWETPLDPTKRSLVRVTIQDAALADKRITTLMGDKVEPRKEYIFKYANFNKEDNFDKPTGGNK